MVGLDTERFPALPALNSIRSRYVTLRSVVLSPIFIHLWITSSVQCQWQSGASNCASVPRSCFQQLTCCSLIPLSPFGKWAAIPLSLFTRFFLRGKGDSIQLVYIFLAFLKQYPYLCRPLYSLALSYKKALCWVGVNCVKCFGCPSECKSATKKVYFQIFSQQILLQNESFLELIDW